MLVSGFRTSLHRPEGKELYFKQFLNEEAGCSSYLVASRQTKEAAVVDAALNIEPYLQLAHQRGFTIEYAIDTHIHADHVSGARRLAAATGAEVCMYENADVLFPFRGLKDGERLHLGQLFLDILHTPGHRPELISILITNPPRGSEPSIVLTGDALFVGDVGRPDFGGVEGARDQFESIHHLLQLDDYVEVFPAHFEGSCGKGMCGRPSSTIGFERRFNPLANMTQAQFLEATSEAPARPLNMTAIIATNRGEAEYYEAEPHTVDFVPELDVKEAPGWIETHEPLIVDVREPNEYERAHIQAAVSVPQADLASRLQELPRDRDLLVVCAGGVRSLRASNYLLSLGYKSVTSLNGGTDAWLRAGLPARGRDTTPPADSSEPDRYFHAASRE